MIDDVFDRMHLVVEKSRAGIWKLLTQVRCRISFQACSRNLHSFAASSPRIENEIYMTAATCAIPRLIEG